MGLATAMLGLGLRAYLSRRIARWSDADARRRDAARTQLAQLRRLLAHAAATEFGRARGFARLAALPDAEMLRAYRAAVPAADYEAFRPLIARMREGGEPNVLWPGLVRHFAQTSGTTAGDKFIPVSRQMLASNRRAALDIFANLARFGASLPSLLRGKVLFLGGSTSLAVNEHGIATGDLSGLVTPLIRWPITSIYLPGKAVALIPDWPTKIDAMAAAALDADVRMISGMPSWTLVLMERVMAMARERGGERQRPVRSIGDVWPNLRALVHGGVNYAPFDARMRQAVSGAADGPDFDTRLELYPASEGFIAMQDRPRDPGLRLLTDIGNFYEFIPLERVHESDPPAVTADQADKGQRYVVCMSTCAGLWRYIIGDVVEFDSIPARPDGTGGDGPPRLRIVGRHRHFINAFGENLIVEHIENAVSAAARATGGGLVVGEFTAAPVYPGPDSRAGLQLAVEIDARPDPVSLARFAAAFDEALKAQNVDYTTKRAASLGMAAPTVTPLPPGAFHRWMRSRGKLGGQHKCPRCANHREIIDAVLAAEGLAPPPPNAAPPRPA